MLRQRPDHVSTGDAQAFGNAASSGLDGEQAAVFLDEPDIARRHDPAERRHDGGRHAVQPA